MPDTNIDPRNEILFEIETTGASAQTAGYDRLPPGVESSHKMAEMDMERVAHFAERFEVAADKFDLPPALLAGIASRESRAGGYIGKNGDGDHGKSAGIMQLSKTWLDLEDIGPDFGSQAHINQAAWVVDLWIGKIEEEFPEWSDAITLQGATAAYNRAEKAYRSGPENFDKTTFGGDYSNDVVARAQYFAENWGELDDLLV